MSKSKTLIIKIIIRFILFDKMKNVGKIILYKIFASHPRTFIYFASGTSISNSEYID